MEHSLLHALELVGQIIALGGALFVLGLASPIARAVKTQFPTGDDGSIVIATAARWTAWAALGAALATALNLLVETEETQNRTIFGGVHLALVVKFALLTRVGRLSLMRIGVLLLTAAVARFVSFGKWWLVLAGVLGAIVLTSLVSHAAAQPAGRGVIMASQVTHIIAAAAWVGVLIHLLVARQGIVERGNLGGIHLLAGMVRKFSPLALSVATLLGLSGIWMICRFLDQPMALITSAYGLTLLVKVSLLIPAIYAGFINFRIIRPALLGAASGAMEEEKKTALLHRFGRMLELEVTAGLLVVTVAGILASVSPPGGAGAYRLTDRQGQALLRPHVPRVDIVNPSTFLGAAERTTADLRYAEFTHNWSGVMVCLLGLSWLLQNRRGPIGHRARQDWPFLLLPFSGFVAVASDPEVWLFRQVTIGQVLRDPQLLEHQMAAVMVLVLAILGWRNNMHPENNRSFRYGLAIILTAGGVLLLGHAHSTLSSTEELNNLINFQHAIFGAFIISAGAINWLVLRGLFPARLGNLLWPSLVIGLGLYMAFCYRELV